MPKKEIHMIKLNKKLIEFAIMLGLLFTALSLPALTQLVLANPFREERWADPPVIVVHSPLNGSQSSSILLNFTVSKPDWWVGTTEAKGHTQTFDGASYQIDGKSYSSAGNFDRNLVVPLNYCIKLNLTEGSHNVTIRASATGSAWEVHGLWDNKIPVESISYVYFTVNLSPTVSMLSQSVYKVSDVPLDFNINKPFLKVSYMLDNNENITIIGNTTLHGLTNGLHNVTVYAWDVAGNVGVSETLFFDVKVPEPESFPTLLVAVASATSAAIVCAAFAIYTKKHHKTH
jgi:hypothetical protein